MRSDSFTAFFAPLLPEPHLPPRSHKELALTPDGPPPSRWTLRTVRAFYHQVAAAYPDARRIYVVQDNWSIHTHPEVLLAGLPQIEPVWLPTYAL